MEIKLFTLVTLCACVLAYDNRNYNYRCNEDSTQRLAKRASYDFSVKLLQRVTDDQDSHFVYSPLSTWLVLSALGEGATGATRDEIWNVTKHHKNGCFRKQLGHILTQLKKDLRYDTRIQTVMAMDSLMGIDKKYVRKILKQYGIKVLLLNFNDEQKSANAVNNMIRRGTGGFIDDIVYYDDFNSTVLLICDGSYFKSQWKIPFNSAYTKLQKFYSSEGIKKGEVSMMNQIGYFHLTEFPFLGARVLELPFATYRISMLVFLPTNKLWIGELFYKLPRTRLTAIYNMYQREGPVLVNVTMPKFTQSTEVDNLGELVYDMDIKRIFYPNKANLRGISKYNMYVSLMSQITKIEVDEKGVHAAAGFLVNNNTAVQFLVNKPFAYMVVDKKTDFILFAGVYSKPPKV